MQSELPKNRVNFSENSVTSWLSMNVKVRYGRYTVPRSTPTVGNKCEQ